MLSNIVLIILAIYACLVPLLVAKAIEFGMKVGANSDSPKEEVIFNLKPPKKKAKMTAEESRTAQILANIDRYDGTSNGQLEVKREKNG